MPYIFFLFFILFFFLMPLFILLLILMFSPPLIYAIGAVDAMFFFFCWFFMLPYFRRIWCHAPCATPCHNIKSHVFMLLYAIHDILIHERHFSPSRHADYAIIFMLTLVVIAYMNAIAKMRRDVALPMLFSLRFYFDDACFYAAIFAMLYWCLFSLLPLIFRFSIILPYSLLILIIIFAW